MVRHLGATQLSMRLSAIDGPPPIHAPFLDYDLR